MPFAVISRSLQDVSVPSRSSAANRPDLRRLVLIVDDNSDHIEFLRLALGTRYRVLTASNGLDAYAIACREMVDAILLDLMMPVVDGPAVVRKLRANPETSAMPIVLVSALDVEALGPLPQGVNVVLRKPCHRGEILDALQKAMSARAEPGL